MRSVGLTNSNIEGARRPYGYGSGEFVREASTLPVTFPTAAGSAAVVETAAVEPVVNPFDAIDPVVHQPHAIIDDQWNRSDS
jgi:hypothetical protein